MQLIMPLVIVLMVLMSASATAGEHKGDRSVSGAETQEPDGGKARRVGEDKTPRSGKPKPKPKPPKGESGEKGGTEDINIGVGE